MKTSEFMKSLKELNYNYHFAKEAVTLDGNTVATISYERPGEIDTTWFTFRMIGDEESLNLFKLIVEYAATPVAEREDAFYHIRPKGLGQLGLESAFLWHDGEEWRLSDGRSEFTGDENLLYYTLRELEDLGVTKEMREDFYLEHVYGPREEEVEEELPTNDSLISKLLKDLESLSLKDKN